MNLANAWSETLREKKVWFVSAAVAYLGDAAFESMARRVLRESLERGCAPGKVFIQKLKKIPCGKASLYAVVCETSADRRRDNERKSAVRSRKYGGRSVAPTTRRG